MPSLYASIGPEGTRSSNPPPRSAHTRSVGRCGCLLGRVEACKAAVNALMTALKPSSLHGRGTAALPASPHAAPPRPQRVPVAQLGGEAADMD
eukprot:gene30535-biopygen2008